MTQNQIAYQQLQETRKVNEETRRANRAKERIADFSNKLALGNTIAKPITDILGTVLNIGSRFIPRGNRHEQNHGQIRLF